MRSALAPCLLLALLGACTKSPPPNALSAKTVTQETEEYFLRPVDDTNVRKREIPAALINAVENPYGRKGLKSCAHLNAAIAELDAVLGPDVDGPSERRETEMEVAARLGLATAKEFLGGIVPVRSVVRELSGARAADARVRTAVYAGSVRRGYLKGLAAARKCKAPPRFTEAPPIPAAGG